MQLLKLPVKPLKPLAMLSTLRVKLLLRLLTPPLTLPPLQQRP
jgi:hypothetical protein